MQNKKIWWLFLPLLILICIKPIFAQDANSDKLKELNQKITEYEQKLQDLSGQKKTLSTAISYLDNKIQLTTVQIAATEQELIILRQEISELSGKIEILSQSISGMSVILTNRIEATYKRGRLEPYFLFFQTSGFSDLISRLEYLKTAQLHDRELLYTMQKSKMTYDEQKALKEQKQAEEENLKKQLVSQKAALAQQKQSKQELLEVTKNDEKKFQQLLAEARAEMEAIQSIIAGLGEETKAGDITEGARIASIIVGPSACSTGTHLHFEVVVSGAHTNPAGYLQPKDVIWDLCGWYGCDSPFGFSGSWNWPMNDPIRITQGYGMTAYAKSGAYGGSSHTGIDIVSENTAVKAVKNGVLYRGSISCGGGTLRYVKVDHQDSDIDTYYLHVNY